MLSQRAYARSRKARGLVGGTPNAVNKAVRSGRFPLHDGLIDSDEADRLWGRGVRMRVDDPVAADAGGGDLRPEADEDAVRYRKARAAKEFIRVKRERMNLDTAQGKLIRGEDYGPALASILAAARERLRGIGARTMSRLAIEDDPALCRVLVDDEVDAALAALAGDVGNLAETFEE